MTYSPLISANSLIPQTIAADSTLSSLGYLYLVDCSASAVNLTLDNVLAINLGTLVIMKIDSSTNPVNIIAGPGKAIAGLSQRSLPSKYNTIQIMMDGSNDYKILGSILGMPDVAASASSLVLRNSTGDINANNINGTYFSSTVDAVSGDNLPRLSQVQALLSTSVTSTDNSTLYTNNSNQLAIKPHGIIDSLVSSQSSILRSFDASVTYTPNQLVILNNYIWLCVSSTNTTPSNTNTAWRPITGIVSARESYRNIYQNSSYNASETDCHILMDCRVSNLTLTINPLSGFVNAGSSGVIPCLTVIKVDPINILNIQLSGSDTFIDGSTSISVVPQGALVKIFALKDLGQWFIKVL